jgi:hypothetical protein
MPGFTLSQPLPNPFRHATVIGFALGRSARTTLRVYVVAGRRVRTLENAALKAGRHLRVWDGRTDVGGRAAPGVYFSRLESDELVLSMKVILVD